MYFRSQTASRTQPLTSFSEDLKRMYSQASKTSSWGTYETAKHHVFQLPKGVKNPASNNVIFCRPTENVQSSTESLVLGHLRSSQTPCISAPKRRQKPSLQRHFLKTYRECTVKHREPRPGAPSQSRSKGSSFSGALPLTARGRRIYWMLCLFPVVCHVNFKLCTCSA